MNALTSPDLFLNAKIISNFSGERRVILWQGIIEIGSVFGDGLEAEIWLNCLLLIFI